MSPFTPEEFTEDQRAMARTAEEFVDRELIPRVAEIEENKPGVIPTLLKRAGEIGLLGIEVPEEYGGLGNRFVRTNVRPPARASRAQSPPRSYARNAATAHWYPWRNRPS